MTKAKLAIVNVNAHWLDGFEEWRAAKIAAACRRSNVDLIMAQELKTYSNAKLMSRLMGWGGKIVEDDSPKKGDSCVLHGGFAPVATGIIWNPKVIEAINTGQIVTYKDWFRNKWATWADLLVHGKRGRFTCTHLEFEPKGPNTIPKYDRIRFKQTDGALGQLQKPGRTNIICADANCDLDDARDGFGEALEIHGMCDFDVCSKNRQNGDRTLTKTTWTRGGRIIRGGATKDVRLTWQNTIRMYNWTDHNMLVQEFEIPV
jgi:hypothetical protein